MVQFDKYLLLEILKHVHYNDVIPFCEAFADKIDSSIVDEFIRKYSPCKGNIEKVRSCYISGHYQCLSEFMRTFDPGFTYLNRWKNLIPMSYSFCRTVIKRCYELQIDYQGGYEASPIINQYIGHSVNYRVPSCITCEHHIDVSELAKSLTNEMRMKGLSLDDVCQFCGGIEHQQGDPMCIFSNLCRKCPMKTSKNQANADCPYQMCGKCCHLCDNHKRIRRHNHVKK